MSAKILFYGWDFVETWIIILKQKQINVLLIQDLITNNTLVVEDGQNDRRNEVMAILGRVLTRGRRRGGPTKNMLLQLCQLCPGQPEVAPTLTKADIVRVIQGSIPDDQPAQRPPTPPPNVIREPAGGRPVGVPPPGWAHLVGDDDPPVHPPGVKSLLRLKRGELESLPKQKQMELLLKEQEELQNVKQNPGQDLLRYVRDNLQEMCDNSTPLPPELDDTWVIFLYEKTLEKEIKKFQFLFLNTVDKEKGTQDDPVVVPEDESDDEDDLSSYYPNKRYALRKKGGRKRKRKRKKRKKKKKRRRRGSSSSSQSDESSSSSSEEESNSKKVSLASYGPNHYEQLREFREDYQAYYDDGNAGEWPDGEALKFISKKFARAGSKFAHKTQGVRKKFINSTERDHARKRTVQIYDMSDTIAELRLERNETIASELRRMDGATKAKRAKIRAKMRKFRDASVEEEQSLVSRVGVYCDLVLMGKKSWDDFHSELKLGGQKEAIVEGMGGLVSKGVAAKAWRKAQAATVKPYRKIKKKYGDGNKQPGLQKSPQRRCFYCNKTGHKIGACPDKKAGKPPHPNAKWKIKDKNKNEDKTNKKGGIVIKKP